MKKINNIIIFVIFILILFIPKIYAATEITSGYYTYVELSDGTINLKSYSGNEQNVVIPTTIDGKRVKKIDTNTFKDNSTIKTITLPEGLEIIDAYVFNNCSNLTTVSMPTTLNSLSNVFYKTCPNIKYTIPSHLTQLSNGAYKEIFKADMSGKHFYDYASEIFNLVNVERENAGVAPLQYNAVLSEAANQRAVEVCVLFSHTRPNSLSCFSVSNLADAENIGKGGTDAKGMMQAWMGSSGHKANILKKSHKSIGIGVFKKTNGTMGWVQLFSRDESPDTTMITERGEEVPETVDIEPNSTSENAFELKIMWEDSSIVKNNKINFEKGQSAVPEKIYIVDVKNKDVRTIIKPSDLKWNSSNENVCTVDMNGNITAISDGNATVIAKLGSMSLSYEVTVVDNATSFSLNYSTYQINSFSERPVLSAISNTGSSEKVTWSSSNEQVATVDSNGRISPMHGGFVKIIATSERFGSKQCWVYVCTLINLKNGNKAYAGDLDRSGTFTANDASMIQDLFRNGDNSEESRILGDIDGDGSVTANDASYIMDIFSNGTFHPGPYSPIEKITLDQAEAEGNIGDYIKLTATIAPTDTTDSSKITWSSSNKSVATVDRYGNVNIVSKGTATITATSSNGKKATCVINKGSYLIGDVDGDGEVTLVDCTKILLHVRNKKALTDDELGRADIDGDGEITLVDCTKILLHVRGKKLLF